MLDAFVWRRDEHLRGNAAPGDGEEIEVHLCGESLGEVGRGNPPREGNQGICVPSPPQSLFSLRAAQPT